jgi:Ca-activated chloride channel family protein
MNTHAHDNSDSSSLDPHEASEALLTAQALGQIEPGSPEAAAAQQLLAPEAPDAFEAADTVMAELRQIADAARTAAAKESAELAADPDRSAVRQAVIAAIAARNGVAPAPASRVTTSGGGGWSRLLLTAGSLATAVAVMTLFVIPEVNQHLATAPRQIAMRRSDGMDERKSEAGVAEQGREGAAGMVAADRDGLGSVSPLVRDPAPLAAATPGSPAANGGSIRQAAGPAPTAALRSRLAGAIDALPGEVHARAEKAAAPPLAGLAGNGAAAPAPPRIPGRPSEAERLAKPQQVEAAPGHVASSSGDADMGRRFAAKRSNETAASRGLSFEFADSDHRERMLPGGVLAGERTRRLQEADRETYAPIQENPLRSPQVEPLSTFSIDVDTASYANVRRFLTSGRRPPRDAVRIEELINYFRYDDPLPQGDEPFSVSVEAAASPWHVDRLLVRVGLRGSEIAHQERPAGNLVFLIDVSGSMGDANKLPLVKQSLSLLVEELGSDDRISIVTYAGEAGLKLPSTSGDARETILAAINSLSSGGSTHGSAGIELAYRQAAEHFIAGGVNRVILATDGDLNVGITNDDALEALIREKAKAGTFLTVLGFGEGNLQDAKMERIADRGNGIYAYIDGLREARKVLVEQLTGSTITIAKDVKIQVEFNPATVAGYRLIGYENRLLAAEDFRDDTKDAGEIGAGHGVTALYEIVPRGVPAGRGAEPLKYQRQPEPPVPLDSEASSDLLTVKLRWKRPDEHESRLFEVPLADRGGSFASASSNLRFAAAVASFGMLLRGSDGAGGVSFERTAEIAGGALGSDPGGYRAEFVDLVRRAAAGR